MAAIADADGAVAAGESADTAEAGEAVVPLPKKPKRALAEWEIFKQDYLTGQRATRQTATNLTDSSWRDAFWAAWEALPQRKRDLYAQEAMALKPVAHARRKVWKTEVKAAEVANRNRRAQAATASQPERIKTIMVGLGEASEHHLAEAPPPMTTPDTTHPLSEGVLRGWLRDRKKHQIGQFCESFCTKANCIHGVGPITVPEVVDYGRQCPGLCVDAPREQRLLHEHLVALWGSRYTPASVGSDILVRVRVYMTDDPTERPPTTHYILLCSASCRYGRHPAKQMWLWLERVSRDDPFLLQASRRQFVPTRSLDDTMFGKYIAPSTQSAQYRMMDGFRVAAAIVSRYGGVSPRRLGVDRVAHAMPERRVPGPELPPGGGGGGGGGGCGGGGGGGGRMIEDGGWRRRTRAVSWR